jgi:hypothetical protein
MVEPVSPLASGTREIAQILVQYPHPTDLEAFAKQAVMEPLEVRNLAPVG